jgi:hypothetical protein
MDARLLEPIGDRRASERDAALPTQRVGHASYDIECFHGCPEQAYISAAILRISHLQRSRPAMRWVRG